VVAEWIADRTRDEVVDAFTAAGAAIAPVYDVAGLLADPQAVARQMFVDVEHPTLGPVTQQNVLFRMSATPGSIRHAGRALGEDTEQVLVDELGLEPAHVAALRERGVVA
jgi:crotonobetainyl-CoA:carnitine CoA-transferase CaiB-like acyl-CoA transferase